MLKLIIISLQLETTVFFTIEIQAEDADNRECYLLIVFENIWFKQYSNILNHVMWNII